MKSFTGNPYLIFSSRGVENLEEFNAHMRQWDEEIIRENQYKKWSADEDAFSAAHPDDAPQIKICFDWMHEHGMHEDKHVMEITKQHYKKLSQSLPKLRLGSHKDAATRAPFITAVIEKLIAVDFDNLLATTTPVPEETKKENLLELSFQFQLKLADLNALITLVKPLNTDEKSFEALKKLSPQDDKPSITLKGIDIDHYIEVAKKVRGFRGFLLSDDGIHEKIDEQNLDEPVLTITAKDFIDLLKTYEEVAPRYSAKLLEPLIPIDNEVMTVALGIEQFEVLTDFLSDLSHFQTPSSDYLLRTYSITPPEAQLREKIHAVLAPLEQIEEESYVLSDRIFGSVISDLIKHRATGNWKSPSELALCCTFSPEKLAIFRDCATRFDRASDAQLLRIKHWVDEKTKDQAIGLSAAYRWLTEHDLVTPQYCEQLSQLTGPVRENQFYHFTFCENASAQFKHAIFETFLTHLQTLEAPRPTSPRP